MRRGILAGGNLIVDNVKTVDVYPSEQALANILGETTGSGGAAYNVARNLAILDREVSISIIGKVGDDEPGKGIVADCASLGIETSQIQAVSGVPTSYTLVVVVQATGKRTFFHQRGANALLAPEDFDFSKSNAKHFHYGYLLLLDALDSPDADFGTGAARVLAAAREAGLTTSIDLVSEDSHRFRKVVLPALAHADLVFMNEFEAARLTGIELTFSDGSLDPSHLAELRRALPTSAPLVLHWAGGAAYLAAEAEPLIQGCVEIPPELIKSFAGAGDAFAAGFLLAFERGGTPEEGLTLGVCAAAATIQSVGCTDGMLIEKGCLSLGQTYGFRHVL